MSRRQHEKEPGAGMGPSPATSEHTGYTELSRRFVQSFCERLCGQSGGPRPVNLVAQELMPARNMQRRAP